MSRLPPVGMPPVSTLFPSAKYLSPSVLTESLCCCCGLCANELQMYLTFTDLFTSLHLISLLHLSFLTSPHVWPGIPEIERILLLILQTFFPHFFLFPHFKRFLSARCFRLATRTVAKMLKHIVIVTLHSLVNAAGNTSCPNPLPSSLHQLRHPQPHFCKSFCWLSSSCIFSCKHVVFLLKAARKMESCFVCIASTEENVLI